MCDISNENTYNNRADDITIYAKWQLRLYTSVASCYIKRNNKWVDEDIDSFQFGSFNKSLRQKEPLCCKSQGEVKQLYMIESEIRRGSQSRSWDAVVRKGIKMLKSKQVLKFCRQERN